MRVSSAVRGAMVSLACLGLLVPQTALMGAQPEPGSQAVHPSLRIVDVALGSQSTLRGTLVDPQGHPMSATQVVLLQGAKLVALAETDSEGRFVFAGVTGGVYGVGGAGVVQVCRAWAPHTAPPAANQGLLIVSDGQLVRGRGPLRDSQSRIYTWVSEHHLLVYAGIAAAIAVPVVLVGNETNSKS